jgi:hypothetical protein
MIGRLASAVLFAAVLCGGATAARPVLSQPFDVLPLANGSLVVSDRLQRAVYVVDPARKSGRRVASVPEARELERLPDGGLLVTSGAGVFAVDMRTGRSRLYARAAAYLLGIARAAVIRRLRRSRETTGSAR